jgi:hypothetical protein
VLTAFRNVPRRKYRYQQFSCCFTWLSIWSRRKHHSPVAVSQPSFTEPLPSNGCSNTHSTPEDSELFCYCFVISCVLCWIKSAQSTCGNKEGLYWLWVYREHCSLPASSSTQYTSNKTAEISVDNELIVSVWRNELSASSRPLYRGIFIKRKTF